MLIGYWVLNIINPINRLIKTKDFDLVSGLDILKNYKICLENLRSDSSYGKTVSGAKELATNVDVEPDFVYQQ